MDRLIDLLLVVGGSALLAHCALCFFLQRRLRDRPDVLRALFAIPNSAIVKESSVRLLKARYYLLWRRLPEDLESIDPTSGTMLILARLTGLLMPVGLLGFIGISIFQALA